MSPVSILVLALGVAEAAPVAGEESAVAPLAAAVRALAPRDVAALVAGDPRFAALSPAERRELLRAVREPWRSEASALNFVPGFGIGSLAQGDRRGVLLALLDATGVVLVGNGMMRSLAQGVGCIGQGPSCDGGPTPPVLVAGLVTLAVGRVAGVALPATYGGRRHAALARALRGGEPGPPALFAEAPLLVVPVTTGWRLAGAAVRVRF